MSRTALRFAPVKLIGLLCVAVVGASTRPFARAAAPCDPFFLSPIFASYPEDATGGSLSGSFHVWLGAGCTWVAATDAGWIHLTGGATGTGNGGPGFSGTVTYEVAPNPGGPARFAKVYVRAQNTTSPYLEHTVFQAGWTFQPVNPLQLTDISPTEGAGGTIIRVRGSGFGTDPDALAAGLLIDPTTIVPLNTIQGGLPDLHLQVISSDVGTQSAPLFVTRGQGRRGFFKPAFADIAQHEAGWVWTGNIESVSGRAGQTFTLRPTSPPPGTRWFFSGSPSNGALCVYLTGNWSPSNRVSIDLLADNESLHLHRAAQLHGIEFPGGSLLGCAQRLCDILRCAFAQLGPVEVNCEVELVGAIAPVVKLTLSFPEGPITRGGLMICTEPAVPLPGPTITSFSPRAGGEGTAITVEGRNFGVNPHNLSAAILNGASSIPLDVISASETQLVAVVGPIPTRVEAGVLQVIPGEGRDALVQFEHGDLNQPVLVGFLYQKGPSASSRDTFTPQAGLRPAWPKCFFSDPPSGGQVCLTISGNWPTPAKVSIKAGLHDTRAGKGRDIQVDEVVFQPSAIIPGNPPIVEPLNILECAYRICDVIGSGSQQGGGFLVNCTVELVSPGVARICLGMIDGFVDQGHLNVCVQPVDYVPASDYPAITDFYPKDGSPGDVIHIIGRNFLGGPDTVGDPDRIAVSVVNGAMTIPLQAISLADSEIIAVLGDVSPLAQPGPLRVRLGEGQFERLISLPVGGFWTATTDLSAGTAGQLMWTWKGAGVSAESAQVFTPHYVPTSNKKCFYSGPPQGGELILVLPDGPNDQWPGLAAVTIDFEGTSECVPTNLKLLETEFLAEGSVLESAQHICELLSNAWVGGTNPPIPGCVVQQGTNTVVIRVSTIMLAGIFPGPGGCSPAVSSGHLNVCVKPARILVSPQIVDFFPQQGREGDLITINGAHFGTRADNLCAVILDGDNSIPLQVIEASDTRIKVQLGAVPPNARPGRIMIGLGAGRPGPFAPVLADTEVRQPIWVWYQTGESAMSVGTFQALPASPAPGTEWFFSGPPSNGVLSVVLQGAWPSNAQVRIEARAHNRSGQIGLDLRAIDIRLPAGGTLLNCAQRICDVIESAFLQRAGVSVDCVAEEISRASVKLTLSLPGRTVVDWGNLNVCVRPSPDLPPVITSFTPRSGAMDTRVTINGQNFTAGPNATPDPHDYSLLSLNGGLATPFEVLSVTATQIIARVGPVDPNAGAGRFLLGLGRGQQGTIDPLFPDIVPGAQTWTWIEAGAETMSAADFAPTPSSPSPGSQWFFSGPPANGELAVVLRGDWPGPALVRVEARAHDPARRIGADLRAVDVRLIGGGTLLDCSLRICDVIRSAFRQQAGLSVNCVMTPSPAGDGTVKITLSLAEGRIDWGSLIVCVSPVPTVPTPVITSFSPAAGGEGAVITIVGRNFLGGPDTAPADLNVVVREGNTAVPMEVMSATDTMIVAKLGPVPPGSRGGPLVVSTGLGKRGLATPTARGIWPLSPSWAWIAGGPSRSATSAAGFTLQPGASSQTWFFSGAPVGGKLRVVVPTSAWTSDAVARVSLQGQSADQAIGFESGALQIQDRLMQAAAAVAQIPYVGPIIAAILTTVASVFEMLQDLLAKAAEEQAMPPQAISGKHLNYEAALSPDGSNVTVVVSRPTGSIDWGCFNICIARPAPHAAPVITDIQPREAVSGALVRIMGRGFGDDPDNLSLAVVRGDSSVLLRAVSATDTEIVAEVGIGNPNDSHAGQVAIARGLGRRLTPEHHLTAGQGDWVWQNSLDPSVFSSVDFNIPPGCPAYGLYLSQAMYSGPPQSGKLCVVVPSGVAFINRVFIDLQAHSTASRIARELHLIRCFGPFNPVDGVAKAKLFCGYITEAFNSQGVAVNCTVSALPNGQAKLCFGLPEGAIDWGNLRICLHDYEVNFPDCGPVPIPKLEFSRFDASFLELSLPRSVTGYQLEATDDLVGRPPGHVNWVPVALPMRATDTGLKLTLPYAPDQPQLYFRLAKPQPPAGHGD
jgi:hypothetical protein